METQKQTKEHAKALNIIRSILGSNFKPERINFTERSTYLAIQLDGNSWRTICRLYLDSKQKYIGTIDTRKVETRNRIESPADIFKYSKDLIETASRYND